MSDLELLTTAQVLELLQIGRTKLWALVRSGSLPAYRIGEGANAPLRFRRSEVQRWLEQRRVVAPLEAGPRAVAGAPGEGGGS